MSDKTVARLMLFSKITVWLGFSLSVILGCALMIFKQNAGALGAFVILFGNIISYIASFCIKRFAVAVKMSPVSAPSTCTPQTAGKTRDSEKSKNLLVLERLRANGIISEDEFNLKIKELDGFSG